MPTLDWIGKSKVINHHQEVPFRVLENQYTYGADDSENMIIHGDNLEALKALLPRYEGQVKCIYIDPPYNTGNEGWVYNDNVNDPKIRKWLGEVVGKEGEDLSRHDKWLCMMYPRLKLLQRLLHPSEGVIFISIDENEAANLKLVCNEVFGASSFVVTIAWQKRYSRENRGSIGDSHEYILVYATDPNVFKVTRNFLPLTEKQLKGYSNPDNDPRGVWQSVSLLAQGYRPNQMYEIVAPNGMIHRPPDGNCWKVIRSEFEKALADSRVTFGTDGKGVPRRKQFLSETKGLVPWSWWPFEEVGHTGEAKKEMQSILGTVTARYTGRKVLGKTVCENYKTKSSRKTAPEEQYIFEGAIPAIVDVETWQTVQKIRETVRRAPKRQNAPNRLTGLLYCADCGSKLTHRYNLESDDGKYLIMGNGTRAFAVAAEQPEKADPLKHKPTSGHPRRYRRCPD